MSAADEREIAGDVELAIEKHRALLTRHLRRLAYYERARARRDRAAWYDAIAAELATGGPKPPERP